MDLQTKLEKEGVKVPENFFDNIQRYKEHLFKWNKVHNLTGAKDEETIDSFIADALFPLTFLPQVKNILDIGTGAGFPGLILAIALPDVEVTLAEPLAKRAGFLQFIKADLGLKNVTVVKDRVEKMPKKIFDLITSRAVMDTSLLLEISREFRDENSRLLFYKGENVYNELPKELNHKVIKAKNRHYLFIGDNI